MTFLFWYKPSDISNSADLMLFGQDYNTSGNAVTNRSLSIVSYAGKIGIYDYGASSDSEIADLAKPGLLVTSIQLQFLEMHLSLVSLCYFYRHYAIYLYE